MNRRTWTGSVARSPRSRRWHRRLRLEALESRRLLALEAFIGPQLPADPLAILLPQSLPENVAGSLAELYQEYAWRTAGDSVSGPFAASSSLRGASQPSPATVLQLDDQRRPLVDIWASGDMSAAWQDLQSLGIDVVASDERFQVLEAWLDASQFSAVARLPSVLSLTPVYKPLASAGDVMTQGDAVMHADELRDALQFPPAGYDGSGVRVGVLSDSADRIGGGLDSSQDMGDLPDDV